MRQNHSRRAKRKNQKTLRQRYKLYRGAGSPRNSESSKTPEEEIYDDAELLTTSPENPITSASSLLVKGSRRRSIQNPMKWLGPLQKPIVGRIASAGISEMRGMTPRQRQFIQNIATRKSFTDEMMKRLIENKLPYHSNKVAKYLAEVARKRVVRSLLLDTSAPYVLDRVIMIGGPTTGTPYRWPHCMFLDPDGNIVVGSNTPYRFQDEPADRVQVFRYNDGELLKSMCASTAEIGNIVFRDGFIIFPEGKMISFYNYSNGKMRQQLFKPAIEIYKGITVAPEGAMIMGFTSYYDYNPTAVRIVRTDWKGGEIDSVYINNIDKAILCGLTFDQRGKLVVTLCSDEKIEIRVYDYTPFNPKKPSRAPFISSHTPWKTMIFHNVNRSGMVAFDRNGNLLVTETSGLLKIVKYPEGSLVQSIDCRAQSDTQPCTPNYVTAGHNGDIMVCDKKNMCIKIFTQKL
jgi:hypothetical protein